jgi:hypothetical protein
MSQWSQWSQWVFWAAFGLYVVNLGVGVVAQLRLYHFGKAHHLLYFIVFASAFIAAVVRFHPALLVTLLALAVMPKTKPGGWLHPMCAVVGLSGYCWAIAELSFHWF